MAKDSYQDILTAQNGALMAIASQPYAEEVAKDINDIDYDFLINGIRNKDADEYNLILLSQYICVNESADKTAQIVDILSGLGYKARWDQTHLTDFNTVQLILKILNVH